MSAEWITDEAVRAAAEAMEDAAMRYIGRDLGTVRRDDIALARAQGIVRAAARGAE